MTQQQDITIKICAGLGGVMTGSNKVIAAFNHVLEEKRVNVQVTPKLHKVGCLGLCARDVLVDVFINGAKFTYQHVTPEMVKEIVDKHRFVLLSPTEVMKLPDPTWVIDKVLPEEVV